MGRIHRTGKVKSRLLKSEFIKNYYKELENLWKKGQNKMFGQKKLA